MLVGWWGSGRVETAGWEGRGPRQVQVLVLALLPAAPALPAQTVEFSRIMIYVSVISEQT